MFALDRANGRGRFGLRAAADPLVETSETLPRITAWAHCGNNLRLPYLQKCLVKLFGEFDLKFEISEVKYLVNLGVRHSTGQENTLNLLFLGVLIFLGLF